MEEPCPAHLHAHRCSGQPGWTLLRGCCSHGQLRGCCTALLSLSEPALGAHSHSCFPLWPSPASSCTSGLFSCPHVDLSFRPWSRLRGDVCVHRSLAAIARSAPRPLRSGWLLLFHVSLEGCGCGARQWGLDDTCGRDSGQEPRGLGSGPGSATCQLGRLLSFLGTWFPLLKVGRCLLGAAPYTFCTHVWRFFLSWSVSACFNSQQSSLWPTGLSPCGLAASSGCSVLMAPESECRCHWSLPSVSCCQLLLS